MNCPNCANPMIPVERTDTLSINACRRCGTLKINRSHREFTLTPQLVDRCREYESKVLDMNVVFRGRPEFGWLSLGLAESINIKKPGKKVTA